MIRTFVDGKDLISSLYHVTQVRMETDESECPMADYLGATGLIGGLSLTSPPI